MCARTSRLTTAGCCSPVASAMLLLLCLGFLPAVATCPPFCLCASDIISCSGRNLSAVPSDLPDYATRLDLSHNGLAALGADWVSQSFLRLTTLVLSWNAVSRMEEAAFGMTPRLLYLDLSSNRLTALNSSVFVGLWELEELLLIGNQIALIRPGAFSELGSLKRLYLSSNRLTTFPLGVYEDPQGPRSLTFLDLSNNRLHKLPIQSLLSLSRSQQIYLQENPLLCDCALLALLEYWMWKQYRPLVDFRGEFPCMDDANGKANCSDLEVSEEPLQAQSFQIEPGETLRLPCPGLTPPVREGLVLFWVTPKTALNSSTSDPSARLSVLPNGSLEIPEAVTEDSGTYDCVVVRGRPYHPEDFPEVAVAVGNLSASSNTGRARPGGAEHFNTAFTTLASCVVSIILVLLYLYLTPCQCRDGSGSGGCGRRAVALCSDPREAESGQRRSNGKRVVFLEPQAEESDIIVPKMPAMNLELVSTEGILKNGSRTVGQTLADPAHMA